MLSLDNVAMYYGGDALFTDVSMVINARDRIGLVGRNGAGKTTLMKIITGIIKPTEGKVVISDQCTVGYLPQQMKHVDRRTLWKEAMQGFSLLMKVEKELEDIQNKLDLLTDHNKRMHSELLQRYTELHDRYIYLGGMTMEASIEQTLLGLGFLREDFDMLTSQFSGGWRMRIELAKLLLQKNDVLLLDEPTNHLDIESIQWLEKFLENHQGAVVIISHDRALLDAVTSRTVEISLGRVYDYKVPYSKFRELRAERRAQQLAAYRNQQKKIEATERYIERFRYKNTKASQVQSRIKQLEKMDGIEIELEDLTVFNVTFPPAPRSVRVVVEANGLSKYFDEKVVLNQIDMILERGEKVAFVGKNGEGKTTFSRILAGELDYTGKLKKGENVFTGYYAQNQDEIMDEQKTVFETIDDEAVGEVRSQIRNLLGSFLFHGDDIYKKVKVLSGGERSRLAIARLLLRPYNLIILDEPTTHLDMRSKDILKLALQKYDGTLILVSHDREFLEGLVNKVFEFRNGKIRENIGGIYDFLRKKNLENLVMLNQDKTKKTSSIENKISKNKLEYERKREFDKRVRRLEKKIHDAENYITDLEERVRKINLRLSKGEEINDPVMFSEYEDLTNKLDSEIKKWELLNAELEALRKQENK